MLVPRQPEFAVALPDARPLSESKRKKNAMENRKSLPERMTEKADADKLPADHPMRIKAAELDAVINTPGTFDVKAILGTWSRARRCWSEYTGEPLI